MACREENERDRYMLLHLLLEATGRLIPIGLWANEAVVGVLSGLSTALFTRGLSWTVEEVEVFCVGVRKDMKNPKIHSYWPM
jgi:hypothetical protein